MMGEHLDRLFQGFVASLNLAIEGEFRVGRSDVAVSVEHWSPDLELPSIDAMNKRCARKR